jgi:hypothetical protein
MIMIAVPVAISGIPDLVTITVSPVPVSVSIPIAGYLAVVVPSIIAIMIISEIAIMIISHRSRVVAETRIIAESCRVRISPLPVFSLARTIQPVIFYIAVPALSQPFAIIRVLRGIPSIVAGISVIRAIS